MRSIDWTYHYLVYHMTAKWSFILLSLHCFNLLAADLGTYTQLSFENDLLVEVAERKGKAPWIRATGKINAPATKIANILFGFSSYGELFDECFASARLLELKPNSARLHIVWRYPIFFRNRDAVVRYESIKDKNESFRIDWRGDSKPGDPSQGIRINEVEGSTEIVPEGPSHSRLIYRYIGDLGGDFSTAIKETAWKRQPLHYFQAIKNELQKQNPSAP